MAEDYGQYLVRKTAEAMVELHAPEWPGTMDWGQYFVEQTEQAMEELTVEADSS